MNESCTEATRDSTLPIWTVLITTTHQQFALISGPHPPASLGLAASPQLGSAAANGAHRRSAPAPPFPAPLVPHSQSALSAANFDATTKSWEKSPWIIRGRKVGNAPLNVLLQEWMEWMVHVYGTLLWWSSTICTRPDTHCVLSTCWSVVVLCMCVESACTLSGRPRTRVTACRGACLRLLCSYGSDGKSFCF